MLSHLLGLPIRSLEVETFCPPLDIYLNKRVADFERRMQNSGLSRQLDHATAVIATRLRKRRPRRGRPATRLRGYNWEWAKQWTGHLGRPGEPWDSAAAAVRDWEARWEAQRPADTPARADNIRIHKTFQGRRLRLYESLAKTEAAVLCQARTENIGLRAFLFRRGVPGIASPTCPCGQGD